MEKNKQAYLYAFLAALMWSTVASAFKISLRHLDYLHLLLYASFTASVVLFIILAVQDKLSLLRAYSRREYVQSIILGFLNPFSYYVILFKSYSLLPAQEAQPLNFTWPIVLVLLSIPLLRQKISFISIIAVLVSFSGVVVIGTRGDIASLKFSDPLGVSLAVGSSLLWAMFWIYNLKDMRNEVAKLFLNFLSGFFFILLTILFTTGIKIPPGEGFAGAIYVGLFEMGVTFVIWLRALQLAETTAKVSNVIFLSPFISLIFIHYIVGETILPSTLGGLVLIISGIFIQQKAR